MGRNWIWIITIIFATLVLSFSVYSILKINTIIVTPNSPPPLPTSILPSPTPDPDREFSLLVLGYAGAGHDGGSLTDSIIQVNIIPKERKINLISIPRDLWVELPVGTSQPFFSKINAAFPFGNDSYRFPSRPIEFTGPAGGGQMAKSVVSALTGKLSEYFVAIDFTAFTKIVDLLGGIDLQVTKSFVDDLYPIGIASTGDCGRTPEEVAAITATMSGEKLDRMFMCRYETLNFNVGTTHIDGITALKYVRSRHSATDGGDFNRSNRQKQVVIALKDKIVSLNLFSKLIPIMNTLATHVRTDIPLAKIEEFISKGVEYSEYTISSISLNDQNVLKQDYVGRQSVLIPTGGIQQFTEIHQFVQDTINQY